LEWSDDRLSMERNGRSLAAVGSIGDLSTRPSG